MRRKTSFVKLDRGMREWRWYTDGATMRVFLELILTANVTPCIFEGASIGRGQRVISVKSIAETLDLGEEDVRRALNNLYSTGEITVEKHPSFFIVTLVNYDFYQGYYDFPVPVISEKEREANEYASKMFWDAVERTRRKGRKRE